MKKERFLSGYNLEPYFEKDMLTKIYELDEKLADYPKENNSVEDLHKEKNLSEELYSLLEISKIEISFCRDVIQRLIILNLELKEYDDAVKWANEAFNCITNTAYTLALKNLYLGIVLYESGNKSDGKKLLRLADKESEGNVFYSHEKMDYLNVIRGEEKYNGYVENYYGRVYSNEEIQAIEDIDFDDYDLIGVLNDGLELFENSEFEKAIVKLEEAYAMMPAVEWDFLEDYRIVETIADSYFELGEYDKALELYFPLLITIYGDRLEEPLWYVKIGKIYYDRGDFVTAKHFFLYAYAIGDGGIKMFDDIDKKYFDFIGYKD